MSLAVWVSDEVIIS